MRLLIDTHLLIWAAEDEDRVPVAARNLMENHANELLFSPISIAEVSIKFALKRSDFLFDPRRLRRGLLDNGYLELPLNGEHAVALATLPTIHKDPFDRLLVAQALAEGLRLVSGDRQMAKYGAVVIPI